jgi:hypothetical protein
MVTSNDYKRSRVRIQASRLAVRSGPTRAMAAQNDVACDSPFRAMPQKMPAKRVMKLAIEMKTAPAPSA